MSIGLPSPGGIVSLFPTVRSLTPPKTQLTNQITPIDDIYYTRRGQRTSQLDQWETVSSRGFPPNTRRMLADLISGEDDNVLHIVLSFLDNRILAQCVRVNKRFCTVARLCMDPTVDNNWAIVWSCRKGRVESVRWLLQDVRVDPSARNNEPIRAACWEGHIEVVRLLLQDKRVDPSAQHNEAIRAACWKGHLGVVRLLLQDERIDPSTYYNEAIRKACQYGFLEVVRLLLQDKRVDPSALDNEAIRKARANGHHDIVQLLWLWGF